jgi:hypothetical protein
MEEKNWKILLTHNIILNDYSFLTKEKKAAAYVKFEFKKLKNVV